MEYRITRSEDYLQHHGILGQKWGVRRFQNPDGTLTAEGKKRYQNSDGTLTEDGQRYLYKSVRKAAKKSPDPGNIVDVGQEAKNRISQVVEENKQLFKDMKSARENLDHLEVEFKQDKKLVEDTILHMYDRGIPFDAYDLKEVNGDVTPSLLKLANNKEVVNNAYSHYINSTKEGRYKWNKRFREVVATSNKYIELQKDVADSLLGKYGKRTVAEYSKGLFVSAERAVQAELRKQSAFYLYGITYPDKNKSR